MATSAHRLPFGAGRTHRSLVRGGLLLAVALLISLATSAQAQASACASTKACLDDARWKDALAEGKVQSASTLRSASKQKSNEGIIWRANENAARQRGDTAAANWYKAIADQLFREATYLANVANQRSSEAVYLYAAAEDSGNKALSLAGGFSFEAVYPPAPPDVNGTCASGDACTAGAPKVCKYDLKSPWNAKVGGEIVYKAMVYTDWCWRGETIVYRHSTTDKGFFTLLGKVLRLHSPRVKTSWSACNYRNGVKNDNCLTRFQYGFTKDFKVRGIKLAEVHYGGCIATRIYGNRVKPNHARNSYGGDCQTGP